MADDDIDIRMKLLKLFNYQLGEGNNCSLKQALEAIGLAKTTYEQYDKDLVRKIKEEVATRIEQEQVEASRMQAVAVAQMEIDLKQAEIQIRQNALKLYDRIVQRMGQVVDQGGDFNAAKAAEVVIDLTRNGLQPDRRGQVVVNQPAPPQTPQPLLPGRRQNVLPMPGDLQPAEQVQLPTEVQTTEKFPDGTVRETTTVRPKILDSALPDQE